MFSNPKKAAEKLMTMEDALDKATATVNAMFDPDLDFDKQVPFQLLKDCKGLAFLTVIKAGFVWTAKIGVGIVISKLPDGTWSAPSGIGCGGVGFGAEIGGERTDFLIILNSDDAVKSFTENMQASAGANISLAAGPMGRTAQANANVSKSGVAPNYTYSRSQGLFGGVGVSLSGIGARTEMNGKFYGRPVTPLEILTGAVEPPAAGGAFYAALQRAATESESVPAMKMPNAPSFKWPNSSNRMPAAATGNEVSVVYERVLGMVQSFKDEAAVEEFKLNCKDFGQDRVTAETFNQYLVNSFTNQQLVELIPEMARLLPAEEKRTSVWQVYEGAKTAVESQGAGTAQGESLF